MSKYHILKEYETNLMNINDILGNGSTDNIQLYKIGKLLFDKRFIGVFPSNKIGILKNNEMCILNTDDKKGVHWCACYKYKNKHFIYDSFNRNVKNLSKHWKHKSSFINSNIDRDQSYEESDCGQRSIAWLISFDKYKEKIINLI